MPDDTDIFDPVPAIAALAEGGVDFVVIGGVAGGVYGSAYGTFDLDIAYARTHDNLVRLAVVLTELHATLRGAPADTPFVVDAKTLENGMNFTFTTKVGWLDVLGEPLGAPAYSELRAKATVISVRSLDVRVASLDHLIAMKEAAGRPKDKLMATEYRGLSDLLRKPNP
jgi:hypothetical protein